MRHGRSTCSRDWAGIPQTWGGLGRQRRWRPRWRDSTPVPPGAADPGADPSSARDRPVTASSNHTRSTNVACLTNPSSVVFDGTSERLLAFFLERPASTIAGASIALDVARSTVARDIAELKLQGRLVREGPTKGGRWTVS